MNLNFIKLDNKKKKIIKNLIFYAGLSSNFILSTQIDVNAINISNIMASEIVGISNIMVPEIVGEQNISGTVNDTIDCRDGGMISIGTSYNAQGLIIKHDKSGGLLWNTTVEGSGHTYLKSVTELNDGSIIVVGYSNSTNAGFENKGGDDAIMIKYSKDGIKQWIKSFGGSKTDDFKSVLSTSDGGFIVAGDSDSSDAGFVHKANNDAFLIKYDKDGNQEFMKMFQGNSKDCFDDMKRTSDGGIIVTGYSYSYDMPEFTNNGTYDAILVKYDRNYNQEWVSNFGGSGRDFAEEVVETTNKDFVILGYGNSSDAGFENPDGESKKFLVRFNKNGNFKWVKDVGQGYATNCLAETSDGGVVFEFGSSLIKYDKDGNRLWNKGLVGLMYKIVEVSDKNFAMYQSNYMDIRKYKYHEDNDNYKDIADRLEALNGNTETVFGDVKATSDGGFIAVGYSNSNEFGLILGNENGIIVKYSKDGNVEWKKSFEDTNRNTFTSVTETASGDFIATGGTMDENYDLQPFLVKFNKSGDEIWTKYGTLNDLYQSIIKTSNGELLLLTETIVSDTRKIEPPKDRLKLKNRNHRLAYFNVDAVIKKINEDGDTLSEITFGGSGYESIYCIKETSDNGFIIVGDSDSTDVGFDNKDGGDWCDAVIVKYSQDGTQQWVKGFGGDDEDTFISVVETSDGGFIAIGISYSSDIIYDNEEDGVINIVKYDNNGNQLWAKLVSIETGIMPVSAIESDNGFVVAGYELFNNVPILAKFNNEGEVLWSKPIENYIDGLFKSIAKTSDGNYVAVGCYQDEVQDMIYGLIVKYSDTNNYEYIKSLGHKKGISIEEYEDLRGQINLIPSLDLREMLNERLNSISVDLGSLELKKASANLDVYIKSENMLSLSLNTNSITFDDYSGIDEIEQQNAVEISINSSLPYQLNAYLLDEMYNSDKSKKIDKDRLQIKDNTDSEYKEFTNINEKLILKDSCESGNDKIHNIDLKLQGGNAYESDIYKTVIKFEAEQK